MITLGVDDLAVARAFYARLGFEAAGVDSNDVCFFDMSGTVLGLYGRQALADEAHLSDTNLSEAKLSEASGSEISATGSGRGFRGLSCALNLDSKAAVDAAFELVTSAGGTVMKAPEHVFWGGYSGYFADPDGHLWEIAYNPIAKLDANGHMQLPPPSSSQTSQPE